MEARHHGSDRALQDFGDLLVRQPVHFPEDDDGPVVLRKLSDRPFKRTFTLADNVEIKGAEMINGLLKIWLEHLADEGAEWTPERFEFAFGLDDTTDRDPGSTPGAARIGQRFPLRGSIHVIERHQVGVAGGLCAEGDADHPVATPVVVEGECTFERLQQRCVWVAFGSLGAHLLAATE